MVIPLSKEEKYTAHSDLKSFGLDYVSHHCNADPEYPSNYVHSIYFDTPGFRANSEKNAGDFLKEKLRLRWYSSPSTESPVRIPAYFEVKKKIGGSRNKQRAQVDVDAAWINQSPLLDPRLDDLLKGCVRDLDHTFPSSTLPVIAIRYLRHRFICPFSGARIALDTDIQCQQTHPGVFPSFIQPKVNTIVLEIKYKTYQPMPWLHRLVEAGFRSRAFSKFGTCVTLALEGHDDE